MANSGDTLKLMKIVKDIADNLKIDESFFVADLSDVLKKYDFWKMKLPRVQPFYAVKTNNEEPLLRLMLYLGAGFDCTNKNEMEQVLALGASPSQIVYTHTFKIPSHLKYAREKGVDLLVFDSEEELLNIRSHFPASRLLLRFRVPDVQVEDSLSNKFGCDITDVHYLLETAKRLDLLVAGTCFHVGGLCQNPANYSKAIKMGKEVFDIAEKVGYKLSLLDIGAGFSGHLECYEEFGEICDHINEALEEHFPMDQGVQVIAEPGTYFAASAFTLCAYIFGKREIKPNSAERREKVEYYVYDGVHGSFVDNFGDLKVQMKPLLTSAELNGRPELLSKIWGYTSTESDCIREKCLLPLMNMGEFIVFMNMGAYSISLTSHFNGFLKPFIQYVFSDKKGKIDWDESKVNEIIQFLQVEVTKYYV